MDVMNEHYERARRSREAADKHIKSLPWQERAGLWLGAYWWLIFLGLPMLVVMAR